jgi:hypothetical protein
VNKTFKTLKRAVDAGLKAAAEPAEEERHKYKAAGKPVLCSHCGGSIFAAGPAFTPILIGKAIQCVRCSHLEIFAKDILVQVALSASDRKVQ